MDLTLKSWMDFERLIQSECKAQSVHIDNNSHGLAVKKITMYEIKFEKQHEKALGGIITLGTIQEYENFGYNEILAFKQKIEIHSSGVGHNQNYK